MISRKGGISLPSHQRKELFEVTRTLVDIAVGRVKADLVIKGSNLVNVHSGELLENVDVAAKSGRIALVGSADHAIGNETTVIRAKGQYLAPGFLDGHVHVESSMVTLTQFARVIMPNGTTSVFIDPHEIANVLGLEGVRLMIDESKGLPLKVFVCVPSCVPSAPNLETAGAEITLEDIEEALEWDEVIGLGEVMNYPGVLYGDEEVHRKIQAALRVNKLVEGHSDGLLNKELAAYAAAGITSCHEATRKIEGNQRLRLGLHTMIREGSAWRDVAEVIKCITEERLDSRHVVLVTDDRDPESLIIEGHMDHVVRRAIEEGVDPITAIQMATLNTAEHFGVSRDIGSIAPSKCADMLILSDLSRVRVDTVIADGVVISKEGKILIDTVSPRYPNAVKRSIHLKRLLIASDFKVNSPVKMGKVKVHVMGVVEEKATTRHLVRELDVRNGEVHPSVEKDVVKVAVVERHKQTGNIGLGFVEGFGLREGAAASSIAHDSHNIIVVGADDRDMAVAVNALAETGGGIVVVKEGETSALLELPIAGLMSEGPIEVVSKKLGKVRNALVELGCTIASPFMTLSLLALPVLPELRITDKGLVDVKKFKLIDIFDNEF